MWPFPKRGTCGGGTRALDAFFKHVGFRVRSLIGSGLREERESDALQKV